jgi:murein L,D-transpeptidase YafK
MVHLVGNIASIRAALSRALTATAVIGGALMLAGCYGEDAYQLPTRAMKELSPEMVTLLQQKNMPKDSPVLVRIFKEESELEVWKETTAGRFELLKVYPICRWSGELGPKVKEGDRQAPEGFYPITPGLMNPNSSYYLAINTGFPNAYDRANGYSGAFLMIHGDCSSRGCYAMTDEQIGEIYSLARESFLGGQKEFQVQAYPFRMTPANLARHRTNPNMAFWKMLKEGNDHFEVSHLEPKVDVCERHYVFDAQPPAGSTKPLVFNPSGRCPVFDVNPDIAGPADEKQKNDEYQIAELTKFNAPVAPITMGTDGGMNRVFIAKLDQATASYDDEGHIHAPPIHPGMPPPTIAAPTKPEDRQVAIYNPSQPKESSGFLATLFGSKSTSTSTTASTPPSSDSGNNTKSSAGSFFANLFKPKSDAVASATPASESTGTATAEAQKPKPALASIHPKPTTEAHRNEPQKEPAKAEADAAAAPPRPPLQQNDASAAPPAAPNSGVIAGAQPVVSAGSFDSRWAGVQ